MKTIEERLILVLQQQFFGDLNITPQHRLVDDLGADSLDTVEIIMAIEAEFDIDISDEDAEPLTRDGSTVQGLIDYLTVHHAT